MKETVSAPDVEMFQVLDADGTIVDSDRVPDLSDDELLDIYRNMLLAKRADEKMLKLQRQGRLGTYASCRGQEAAQIGSAFVLEDDDWLVPAFRELAAWVTRGLELSDLIVYWQGDERGMQIPEEHNDFTVSIPVGSQVPHAAGIGWGSKLNGDGAATLCYFGDGATSEGDFHEGMNFAGAMDLPVVFVCQNNQWAISVPRTKQTGADSLAQKALAYGFDGIQVDGNDVLAMVAATREAVESARDGDPVLIEAYTYRLSDHTTADDASRYRTEDEVAEWKKKDPVDRFATYLRDEGVLDDDTQQELTEAVEDEVDAAVEAAESIEDPDVSAMFEDMYSEMPPRLERQLQEMREHRDAGGDEE